MTSWDPAALRTALENQQNELAPIARVLAAAAAHPPRFSPHDWRGAAADACARLSDELGRALVAGDQAVDAAMRDIRHALTELGV
jgi:hypothetical protein